MATLHRSRVNPGGVHTFVLHFLEMCLVAGIGGAAVSTAMFGFAALVGVPNLASAFPELASMAVAVSLAFPTLVWMRLRRMSWAPTLELSGQFLAVVLVLLDGYWLGLVPRGGLLAAQLTLAIPVLGLVMLSRPHLYASTWDETVGQGARTA